MKTTSASTSFKEYSSLDYLKIDIANNYGKVTNSMGTTDLEKLNFEPRIKWFNDQEKAGNLVKLLDTADKPALYFAGLQAYRDTMEGKPTGYPISLDACSSGLQILAATTNCETSARMCGVVDTGYREDAYTGIYEIMLANGGADIKATRSDLKQALMTALYGSKAMPRQVFGYESPSLRLFYETVEQEIPGAWHRNLELKAAWPPYQDEHYWVMPDNFHVCMAVEASVSDHIEFFGESVEVYTKQRVGTATGLSLSPNIVHSIDALVVREITRRCMYDPAIIKRVETACKVSMKRGSKRRSLKGSGRKKDKLVRELWQHYMMTGFLSSRVLEVLDERNIGIVSAALVLALIKDLPKKPFPVLSVHDCFRVHPNYGNDLRRQYNYILSDIAKGDIMSDILTQVTGKTVKLQKEGDIHRKIRYANYTLS